MKKIAALACFALFVFNNIQALPKYVDGSINILGVQLLQDHEDENLYYYIPGFPVLSKNRTGDYEFQFTKYVADEASASGGFFHALLRFDMPAELLKELEKELRKKRPNARIDGPVTILENQSSLLDENNASFQIVSSIVDEANDKFTSNVVSSGHAPFIPGSKSAISVSLTEKGATLMEQSLRSSTSDLSIAVKGYYSAYVEAYSAEVIAEMSQVYEHFSELSNKQKGFNKREIRKVVDSLVENKTIEINVLDRTKDLDVKSNMPAILDLITEKITAVMFDDGGLWSGIVTPEEAVTRAELNRPGDENGKFARGLESVMTTIYNITPIGMLFPKKKDYSFITENLYKLKEAKKVERKKFYMNLNQANTIRIPFYTTGNINLFYESNKDVENYFSLIDMNDKDFQRMTVTCNVQPDYTEAFTDLITSVKINIRSTNPDSEFDHQMVITQSEIRNGEFSKAFPSMLRLGNTAKNWNEYEYQVEWEIPNYQIKLHNPSPTEWTKGKSAIIPLTPPLEKVKFDIAVDDYTLIRDSVSSVNVQLGTKIADKPVAIRNIVLRPGDGEKNIVIFCDPNAPIVAQQKWYVKGKEISTPLQILKDGLFLQLPVMN